MAKTTTGNKICEKINLRDFVGVVLEQTTKTNKIKTKTTKLTPWENRDEQYEVVKWNAEEKWWKNRGGHSEACFQAEAEF